MFRRKSEAAVEPEPDAEEVKVGKGRPTPTRKEAEAAAKARAKVPRTRKEIAAAQRASRGESSQKARAGMRSGDERYLPARDKGPVRRFIRDYIDSRFGFVEMVIPLLIVTMVLGYSGRPKVVQMGNLLLAASLIFVVGDVILTRFRLRRQLAIRFPDESPRGTTYYAVSRAMLPRFMRMPKAQVRVGQKLPERYK